LITGYKQQSVTKNEAYGTKKREKYTKIFKYEDKSSLLKNIVNIKIKK